MNELDLRNLYQQARSGPAPRKNLARSQEWLARSRRVIPGAAQTFSKGTTQYVQGVSPVFLQRGRGCRVWDVDGNEYIDYVQGLLPNILGYAHEEVNAAYSAQLAAGTVSPAPPDRSGAGRAPDSADPCAEKVRYGKTVRRDAGAAGGAGPHGRERVACCGYHGWLGLVIGSTTRNAGVPEAVRGLTIHSL
jgi:hypothetical protein